MPTYDVSIVLTVKAEDEDEAADIVSRDYNLDVDDPPKWGAIVIRELKP